MSHVLGAFVLLDFTMFSLGARFETYEPFILILFSISWGQR
jgi:hypothetical protein